MRLDFAMAYDPPGWRAAFVTLAMVYAAAHKQHRDGRGHATASAKPAPRIRY